MGPFGWALPSPTISTAVDIIDNVKGDAATGDQMLKDQTAKELAKALGLTLPLGARARRPCAGRCRFG